jgi:small nuclear ribonucleoprotein (snRNP)-like protein
MGYFMSDNIYQVIFSGQILEGFDENDVRKNLEPLFSGQVEYLFDHAPIHIKQNIPLNQAQTIANKLEQLGAKCNVSPMQEEEITLTLESDETPLSLETSDDPDEKKKENDMTPPDTSQAYPKMICPSCGVEQAEADECINCGIIIDRYQDAPENIATDAMPKKDILQEYLEEMSQMPSSEPVTETEGISWFLKLTTILVLVTIISAFGWSYYYFVYKKPWREIENPCVSVQEFDDQAPDDNQFRLQSKKETILALQKAMERKEKLKSTNKFSPSEEQFKLKNIPIPLLRHYIGKYVWVTCDNDSVHQGTLFAIYKEQIILKKPRFHLTIPINISMIRTVEFDMAENKYDDDAVKAYQAYKRKTEEALQQVSISSLGKYSGKNLRIHLCNGQVYEGVLSKCKSKEITLQNIVYNQMVTFVIRKKNIDKIFY